MTGWRMGYIGAPLAVAQAVNALQSHQTSNICSITQKASVEALNGPTEARDEMAKAFTRRRKLILEELDRIPCIRYPAPDGAFYVFIDCRELTGKHWRNIRINHAADLADILLNEYSVAVIPCADFGYPDHIRLSYAISDEDIVKGVRRMAEMISEVK